MGKEDFLEKIRNGSPADLAREYLHASSVCVFRDADEYASFRSRISGLIPNTDHIAIVGSGNWRFSLNPEKRFREFCEESDIDVALISPIQYYELWEEMRLHHRQHFYALSLSERERVRRNGENVYSGFISPAWIPNRDRGKQYEYRKALDTLSDKSVNFLKVKMMFFKNEIEAIDYYSRGFRAAQREL